MKTIKLVFLLMAIATASTMEAQQKTNAPYKVMGIVADSITNEGEPFATILIYRQNNSEKPEAMLVSNEKGVFMAGVNQTGAYRINISSVGRKTIEKDFEVTGPVTRLATFFLAEDVNQLEEVSVVAKKTLVKVDMDKIAYDVSEDPDSETKTILDMMRKVPMISVDGEDNISLAGKQEFKIYVNGKPNTLMSNNPKEVLRSMPANSVKNIEVITNPGARYDAEGIGGIINIVTTEKLVEGYNINVSGKYSTNNGYGGSLFGTTQIGKLAISGGYSYSNYRSFESKSETDIDYFKSEEMASVKQIVEGLSHGGQYHNAYLDASYELNPRNLFTLSGGFNSMSSNLDYRGYTQALQRNGQENYFYRSVTDGNMRFDGGNLSMDYQFTSPKNNRHIFVLSYRMNANPTASDNFMKISDGRNYEDMEQMQRNEGKSWENTVQADYTLPIKKMHTLNFGAKYINRINDSDNMEYHRNHSDEEWKPFEREGSGDTHHRQHVLGIYTEYNLRYKSFGLKGGVRYEYTTQHVDFEKYKEQNFTTGFSDVVPSVLLSQRIGQTQNITLGYNMRISRPGIRMLNPFRNISKTQLMVNYGNPNLNSEHYHTLTFSYGLFSPKFSINLNPEYNFCNDGVVSYTFLDKDHVINQTYDNIGRKNAAGINLFANWAPTGSTRLTLNAHGQYTWIENNGSGNKQQVQNESNHGPSVSLYANVNQNLPWRLNLSVYGGYGKSGVSLTSVKTSQYYYYGVQLQRSFLKEDRLTVSASASSFAPKYMIYKSIDETPDYRSSTTQRMRAIQYIISVSYKIGTLKNAVKKAMKSIRNTDIMSGEGGGMPQGGK